MSDFVSELRRELVAAAEREEERRLPRAPLFAPRLLLLGGAAVAAAAAVVLVLALGGLRSEPVHNNRVPAARPTPEGRELFGGTLEEGVRYRTRAFIPALSFVATGPDWGVLDSTRPDLLSVGLGAGRKDLGGGISQDQPPLGDLAFARIPEVYNPNVKGLDQSRTAAPSDLYAWLRAHPDLRVGGVENVTVAGVPGRRFDATARFDRPVHEDPVCMQRTLERCTALAPNFALFDGDRVRVTILQTEPDPLVIAEIVFPGANAGTVHRESAQLLDTLRIGVS
jgi:hypothetical protein